MSEDGKVSAEKAKYGSFGDACSAHDAEKLSVETAPTERLNGCFLGLVALLCTATVAEGYDMAVLNAAIVQIRDRFELDAAQTGLIVAVTPASTFFGALLQGGLADRFGRRVGLVFAVTFLMWGPLAMAFAGDLGSLVVGRAISGLGIGGGFMVITLYIAELAPTSHRGRLVACQEVALNVGMVIGFFMGWLLLGVPHDWRWMLLFGAVLPFPLAIALLAVFAVGLPDDAFLPETPRWLTQRMRFSSALTVLERYQSKEDAAKNMRELREECEKADEEFISWGAILCAWGNGPLLRMLMAAIVVAVGEMICGGTSVAYYSNSIMNEHMGKAAAFGATVIMGAVRLGGVSFAALMMDNIARRTLLLTSASVMTVACIWVGLVARYQFAIAWMLPAGLCLMMLGFVIGLGSVSLVYISEVFPTRIRGKGMVICMAWCRLIGMCSAMAYPLLIERHGVSTTFFLQAAINFGLLCLLWNVVHETKGLSLEQAYKLFDSPRQ